MLMPRRPRLTAGDFARPMLNRCMGACRYLDEDKGSESVLGA